MLRVAAHLREPVIVSVVFVSGAAVWGDALAASIVTLYGREPSGGDELEQPERRGVIVASGAILIRRAACVRRQIPLEYNV